MPIKTSTNPAGSASSLPKNNAPTSEPKPKRKAPSYAGKAAKAKQITTDILMPRIVTENELLPDGVELLNFILEGQAATKKNSQQKTRFGILPSKQYMAYEKLCEHKCLEVWTGRGKVPIDFGVAITMRVFLQTWQVGDATGYMQSVADIMQKHGILKDDAWLHWSDGGQHWFGGVDKTDPRIEVRLVRLRHPKEAFRAAQEIEAEAKKERALVRAAKAAAKLTTITETHNE